jgi:hypothetical protein
MPRAFGKSIRPAIAIALVFGLGPAAHADPATLAVRAEIVALSQQLMDAIGTGDRGVWNRIAADDAVIVDEFGRRQTRRELVEGLRPLPPGFSGSIEIRDPQVQVYGDTAVIVCEEYERETVFGQQLVVRYVDTNTFVRRGGAWKLVSMEDVTLPTPPPRLAVADLHPADYAGVYRYGPDRAWTVSVRDGGIEYRTRPDRPPQALEPVARDVFMGTDDERNLYIFRRDGTGRVVSLVERRKFNDLVLTREGAKR